MTRAGMVQVFEVPVDELTAGLMRAYEIHVPTEDGRWCEVNVMHNLVRDTYETEWSAELMSLAPQALTAIVQLVMLTIQERRAEGYEPGRVLDSNGDQA